MKHSPKVFIVDDEPPILSSLEALLGELGYAVKCFNSAEEFLVQYHPSQIGCILVDLMMPGMGGSELLKRLQDTGSLLSIVILSGRVEFTPPREVESLAFPRLEKPYEITALLQIVENGIAASILRRSRKLRGPSRE